MVLGSLTLTVTLTLQVLIDGAARDGKDARMLGESILSCLRESELRNAAIRLIMSIAEKQA